MNAALSIDASGLDHTLLPPEQEGTATAEQLVLSSLRLALKAATAYEKKCRGGVELEDLFAVGCEGLLIAADRFEPGRGHRFSSYAVHWIRQRITRHIANNIRAIRVPVWAQDALQRRAKAGDEPKSECELAALKIIRGRAVSIHPHDDREDYPGLELIDEKPDPFEVARLSELKTRVHAALAGTLDRRSANILTMRFGLSGEGPMSLEAIGKRFKLTRERIRQLEGKALERLRDLCPQLAEL